MIKAIIFDFGGIFSKGHLRNSILAIGKKYEVDPDQFNQFTIPYWNDARVNKISSKVFWNKCAEYLKVKPTVFRRELLASFTFEEAVLKFAKELRKQYKLAILTNNLEDWFEELRIEYSLDEVFDAIITSYEEKTAKPDKAIYEKTIAQLGITAEECIYVDDNKYNLEPAKELGMIVLLFENLHQFKKELAKLLEE